MRLPERHLYIMMPGGRVKHVGALENIDRYSPALCGVVPGQFPGWHHADRYNPKVCKACRQAVSDLTQIAGSTESQEET